MKTYLLLLILIVVQACGGSAEPSELFQIQIEGNKKQFQLNQSIGIAITNLNEGGRLAACSGNLIRNITRKRFNDGWGVGIGADGDTALTGNVVENAARSGIALGWGKYLQNAVATGNMIKDCPIGVEASTTKGAGQALISNNIIVAAKRGGVLGMNHNEPATGDLAKPGVTQPANLTVSGNQLV